MQPCRLCSFQNRFVFGFSFGVLAAVHPARIRRCIVGTRSIRDVCSRKVYNELRNLRAFSYWHAERHCRRYRHETGACQFFRSGDRVFLTIFELAERCSWKTSIANGRPHIITSNPPWGNEVETRSLLPPLGVRDDGAAWSEYQRLYRKFGRGNERRVYRTSLSLRGGRVRLPFGFVSDKNRLPGPVASEPRGNRWKYNICTPYDHRRRCTSTGAIVSVENRYLDECNSVRLWNV